MARTTRARRRLLLVVGVLVGMVALGGVAYGGLNWYRTRQALEARVEGMAQFDAGRYESALPLLSTYVSRYPGDTEALLRLAKCRAKVALPGKRHLTGAAGFYKAALRQSDNNREALAGLLEVYGELGFRTELQGTAESILKLDPKDPAALEALVTVYRVRGDWAQADSYAKKLVEAEPQDPKWRLLALRVAAASGADEATRLSQIEGWIKAGEPDGRYRLMLALVLAGGGQAAQMEEAALAAAEMGMPNTECLSILTQLLDAMTLSYRESNPSRAQTFAAASSKAIALASKAGLDPIGVALMQAERYWLAGNAAEAELALAASPAAAEGDGRSFELLRWQVVLSESSGDRGSSDKAIAAIRERVKSGHLDEQEALRETLFVDAVVATRDLGRAKLQTIEPTRALLEKALQASPKDPFLHFRNGQLNARIGEVDSAYQAYRNAFNLTNERWIEAGYMTAEMALRGGRTEEGFRTALDVFSRSGGNGGAMLVLAEACTALTREGRSPSLVDPTLARDTTGSKILGAIYAQMREPASILPALVSARLVDGDVAGAKDLAEKALNDESVPADIVILIAQESADNRMQSLPDRLLAVAESRKGHPEAIAATAARVKLLRGDATAARRIAESALAKASEPEDKAALARLAAEAAVAAGDTDATQLLSGCMQASVDDVETAAFLLSQEATWRDESLVNAAIDRMAKALGPDSARVVLSEAARTLRFHANSSKDVAESIKAVNQLLNANSDSTGAMVAMSRLLAINNPPDFRKASEYLEKVLALQPGRRDLLPEMVNLLQLSGDFQGANRYLQQYMRSAEASDVDTRIGAALLMSQGQYGDAARALERIAGHGGEEADLIALGDAQRRAGQLEKAEQTFAKAYASPRRSPMAALSYCEFLARSGRLEDARRIVREDAAAANPSLPPSERAALQARLELDYGDPVKAKPFIEEAVKLLPDNPAIALLHARYLRATGDEAGAIQVAQAGLAKTPKDPALLGFVSSLLIGDRTASAEADKAIESLRGASPEMADLIAVARSALGPDGAPHPTAEVLRDVDRLTDRYPNSPPVWRLAADLYLAANRLDDAIRMSQRGMLRLPSEPGPAEMTTRLLMAAGRYRDAKDPARAWRALTAESPFGADVALAELALREKKPKEALAILEQYRARLAAAIPGNADGVALYTLAAAQSGHGEDAFTTLLPRLKTDLAARGEWCRGIRATPTSEAIAFLDRAAAAMPGDDNAIGFVAEYAAIARRSDGREAAARASALLKGLAPAASAAVGAKALAADIACMTGDIPAGAQGYEAIWAAIPSNDREALVRWASLDDAAKQRLGASRMFGVYANNNLASALASAGRDLDKALVAVDRALAMVPNDASCLDTKAQVLLARGELDQARAAAAEAAQLAKGQVGILVTLARIELAAKRFDDAARRVQEAELVLANDALVDPVQVEALADVKAKLAAAQRTKG